MQHASMKNGLRGRGPGKAGPAPWTLDLGPFLKEAVLSKAEEMFQ